MVGVLISQGGILHGTSEDKRCAKFLHNYIVYKRRRRWRGVMTEGVRLEEVQRIA